MALLRLGHFQLAVQITDNGTLVLDAIGVFPVHYVATQGIDFSGSPITGTGQVNVIDTTAIGGQAVLLKAANTYSGGTTVNNNGTLQLGSSSTGSVTSGPVGTGTLTLQGGTLSSDSTTARTLANAVTFSSGGCHSGQCHKQRNAYS